jgi:hypothetical protein
VSDLDIYVDDRARFLAKSDYILAQMLAGLKRAEVKVRVLDRLDPADTGRSAFLHVDRTTLPPPFRPFGLGLEVPAPECGETHPVRLESAGDLT